LEVWQLPAEILAHVTDALSFQKAAGSDYLAVIALL
jgi:hypothetical protein